jgi:hypothetical protein
MDHDSISSGHTKSKDVTPRDPRRTLRFICLGRGP